MDERSSLFILFTGEEEVKIKTEKRIKIFPGLKHGSLPCPRLFKFGVIMRYQVRLGF